MKQAIEKEITKLIFKVQALYAEKGNNKISQEEIINFIEDFERSIYLIIAPKIGLITERCQNLPNICKKPATHYCAKCGKRYCKECAYISSYHCNDCVVLPEIKELKCNVVVK